MVKSSDTADATDEIYVREPDSREGIGLGLSIARDIIRGHGGEITLTDSPTGGLRVALHLPL